MIGQRLLAGLLAGLVLIGTIGVGLGAAQKEAADKKDTPKKEKRSGTVTGTLEAKGDTWVEVKADGEERARKYVPRWAGGTPAQGGGFDKATVKAIRDLKVGTRVRLEWEFEERPRVTRIEALKAKE